MDNKLLPNRRQITIAIMKHSDLDRTMGALKEKFGDDVVNSREASVVIGSMYKHVTDTMFYLGRTISRVLDPSELNDPEEFVQAVAKLKTIMELTDSFVDGVSAQVKPDAFHDFMDIVGGLELDVEDGEEL